jgi:hypothetical protein
MVTDKRHLKIIDFGTAMFYNPKIMPPGLHENIVKIKQ